MIRQLLAMVMMTGGAVTAFATAPIMVRHFTPPIPVYDDAGEIIPSRYWPPRMTMLVPAGTKSIEVLADWLDASGALVSRHRVRAKPVWNHEWQAEIGDSSTSATASASCRAKASGASLPSTSRMFIFGTEH
jgi:hypothetical protein